MSVCSVYLHDSRLLAGKSQIHMASSVLSVMLHILSPLFSPLVDMIPTIINIRLAVEWENLPRTRLSKGTG